MTTPPMSSRMVSASRDSVSRVGLQHQAPRQGPADAEEHAQRQEVRAEQQQAPQPAIDRPADERLRHAEEDPIDGADGQDHEAPEDGRVHQARTGVPEHLDLHDAVADQGIQAPLGLVGHGRPLGDREDPQVAGHLEHEDDRRGEEDERRQRVERDLLDDHRGRSPRRSVIGGRVVTWRLESSASVSSACGEDRQHGLQRLEGPLRAARHGEHQRAPDDAGQRSRERGKRSRSEAVGTHQLGQPGHHVVEERLDRLRRDVPGREAGAAGRDHQPMHVGALLAPPLAMACCVIRRRRRARPRTPPLRAAWRGARRSRRCACPRSHRR